MTNSNVRSVGSPRVTRSLSRPVVTAAVSVAPSRRPSTCFRPCVSIPSAITMQWSRKTLPSMQTARRSSSPNGRPRNDVVPALSAGMLCLADRNFFSCLLWN